MRDLVWDPSMKLKIGTHRVCVWWKYFLISNLRSVHVCLPIQLEIVAKSAIIWNTLDVFYIIVLFAAILSWMAKQICFDIVKHIKNCFHHPQSRFVPIFSSIGGYRSRFRIFYCLETLIQVRPPTLLFSTCNLFFRVSRSSFNFFLTMFFTKCEIKIFRWWHS